MLILFFNETDSDLNNLLAILYCIFKAEVHVQIVDFVEKHVYISYSIE